MYQGSQQHDMAAWCFHVRDLSYFSSPTMCATNCVRWRTVDVPTVMTDPKPDNHRQQRRDVVTACSVIVPSRVATWGGGYWNSGVLQRVPRARRAARTAPKCSPNALQRNVCTLCAGTSLPLLIARHPPSVWRSMKSCPCSREG